MSTSTITAYSSGARGRRHPFPLLCIRYLRACRAGKEKNVAAYVHFRLLDVGDPHPVRRHAVRSVLEFAAAPRHGSHGGRSPIGAHGRTRERLRRALRPKRRPRPKRQGKSQAFTRSATTSCRRTNVRRARSVARQTLWHARARVHHGATPNGSNRRSQPATWQQSDEWAQSFQLQQSRIGIRIGAAKRRPRRPSAFMVVPDSTHPRLGLRLASPSRRGVAGVPHAAGNSGFIPPKPSTPTERVTLSVERWAHATPHRRSYSRKRGVAVSAARASWSAIGRCTTSGHDGGKRGRGLSRHRSRLLGNREDGSIEPVERTGRCRSAADAEDN